MTQLEDISNFPGSLCLCPLPASACWLTSWVDPPQDDRHAITHRCMTLLKVTSTHRNCTQHSQTWQPPLATLKKMRKPLSKAPRANIPSPSLTETGLYAHFQTKNWLREWTSHQLLPLSWKLDGVFWGHCYMEECIHLEKNQILLARKKMGVGEV